MQNRITQVFFLAILLWSATACSKIDSLNDTVVEGQVIDASTNQPIPFAEVALYAMYVNVSFPAYNSYIIDAKADAKGRFSLRFDPEKDNNYEIRGNRADLYYTVESILPQKTGKLTNQKLTLQPYAYVNVNLINDPPQDYADFRWQQYHKPMVEQYTTSLNGNWDLQIDANKPVEINYWIGKNGGPMQHYSKTVTVSAFDTIAMEIRY